MAEGRNDKPVTIEVARIESGRTGRKAMLLCGADTPLMGAEVYPLAALMYQLPSHVVSAEIRPSPPLIPSATATTATTSTRDTA
jgi:hypothetical protein